MRATGSMNLGIKGFLTPLAIATRPLGAVRCLPAPKRLNSRCNTYCVHKNIPCTQGHKLPVSLQPKVVPTCPHARHWLQEGGLQRVLDALCCGHQAPQGSFLADCGWF